MIIRLFRKFWEEEQLEEQLKEDQEAEQIKFNAKNNKEIILARMYEVPKLEFLDLTLISSGLKPKRKYSIFCHQISLRFLQCNMGTMELAVTTRSQKTQQILRCIGCSARRRLTLLKEWIGRGSLASSCRAHSVEDFSESTEIRDL
jgi:hypothetical protein